MIDVEWYEANDGSWRCILDVCVCGKVRYAAEGEAEGGLGLLVRILSASLQPDVEQPPPSPAGWYWTATRTRGVWTPQKRAESLDAAKAAVEETLVAYKADERAAAAEEASEPAPEPRVTLSRVCDRGVSYGATHLAVSDAIVDGRLSRQQGDALCKPGRAFKRGLGPASPHRRADCTRCLKLADRLGLDVPEPQPTDPA